MSQPQRGRGRKTRPRGSVYWHAASERWCAQTPPDRRGRRRSRYFPADQENAAWRWLTDQLAALDDGIDLAAGSERLSAYLRRWLSREQRNPDRDWSPATIKLYTWAVDRVSEHPLARSAVADLAHADIDQLLADLADDLSRKSIGIIRTLLRSTLEDLVEAGIVRRNPVRRARSRRHHEDRPVRVPWTEDETRKFLAAARRHSKRPALWWLVASCGLRSGEVRGLTLADLDLANGTLTVAHSEDGPTKTRTTRTLDLPANVVAALREHLRQRNAIGGPLFQARPGKMMSGNTLLAELRSLRQRAGVPPLGRVHDLRHLAGSLMLANGYPVTTAAAILGHTPAVLMRTYAHAIPKHVIRAPRNIADVLPWSAESTAAPPMNAAHPDPTAVHPAVPAPTVPPSQAIAFQLTVR